MVVTLSMHGCEHSKACQRFVAASEVAGEAAAALAAAYIALGRTNRGYLSAAESLYQWGVSTSQSYSDSGGRGSTIQNWLYPSTVHCNGIVYLVCCQIEPVCWFVGCYRAAACKSKGSRQGNAA